MSETNNPRTGETLEETFARMLGEEQRRREEAVVKLKAACTPLAALGVARIIWSYDGYGDQGQLEDCELQGTNDTAPNTWKALDEVCKTLDAITQEQLNKEKLEELVYELLPEGFEINDGSYGQVVLETDTREIRIEHNERFTDSRYEEYRY
jgi:hypothetical protein